MLVHPHRCRSIWDLTRAPGLQCADARPLGLLGLLGEFGVDRGLPQKSCGLTDTDDRVRPSTVTALFLFSWYSWLINSFVNGEPCVFLSQ